MAGSHAITDKLRAFKKNRKNFGYLFPGMQDDTEAPGSESKESKESSNSRFREAPVEEEEVENETQQYENVVPYRTYKIRWLGILCLAAMNLMNSWGWLTWAAISSDSAKYYKLSSESPINWLSTVIMFTYAAAAPLTWVLLSKMDFRYTIMIAVTLTVIANWLRYAGTKANIFGLVMFGQILLGCAQPFALGTVSYYTELWFTSASRVSANAIGTLANPLGGAIAELVGPAMVSKPSQLPSFVLVTAIVSTVVSMVGCILPSKPKIAACPSAHIEHLSWKESLVTLSKSKVYWMIWFTFSIYVGLFNAFSTYTNQIMTPYGYTSDEAGYAGACLILCGIVFTAITSPMIDKWHCHLKSIIIQVPLLAMSYIAAIFMCTESTQLAGPFIVSAVIGALSFALLPTVLEWTQEQTSPVDPTVSAGLLWMSGNIFGGIFVIIMNALKYPSDEGSPRANMRRALIFEAVVACLGIVPLVALRRAKNNNRIALDALPIK